MTIASEKYVGIDVAKDKLDVAVLGQKAVSQSVNTKRGIASLVGQMRKKAWLSQNQGWTTRWAQCLVHVCVISDPL